MTWILRVEDVHTYYGASYVLQGVSLTVRAGETVAVLGRNGVGKTTLIRSIVAFTPPARGRVFFCSKNISGYSPEIIIQAGMALVPQGRRIFRSLTVGETLNVAARPKPVGTLGQVWSVDRVYRLFPRLAERRDQRSETLSGGEQQMLVTARALVSNPRMILLDEPTEGLSPMLVKELQDLLRTLRNEGVSLLIVEQRLAFALAIAQRIYLMDKGRIALDTAPEALRYNADMRHRYLGV